MPEQKPQIGLGTAALGRPQYINIKSERSAPFSLEAFRENGLKLLDEAYFRGVRYFDTAPGYGLAEQLVIDWVKEKKDSSIEVATKWGYTYVANFDPNAVQHEVKEHSLSKLNEQWGESIQLLPNLSTYQIHSATLETGVLANQDVLDRLAALKLEHDLIIGISASGANQLEIVKRAIDVQVESKPLFDAFQVTYNILDQSLAKITQELSANNKRVIVKEALANGRLFPNKQYPHYKELYRTLQTLTQKYQVGIDAIALRFCIDSIDPFVVLSGAAMKSHLMQNLDAMKFKLEEVDLMKLKQFKINAKSYWDERRQLEWN